MSDNDNSRSMDEVLASIRRIVRAEREPGTAQIPEGEPVRVSPPEADPVDDAPLALTPDMRMDEEVEETAEAVADTEEQPSDEIVEEQPDDEVVEEPATIEPDAQEDQAVTAVAENFDPAPPPEMEYVEPETTETLEPTDVAPAIPVPPLPPAIDPEEIKAMVRDVVLEELAGDDAGNLVRNVIRDELVNGEIGANISQNVLQLIQSEVAKATSN